QLKVLGVDVARFGDAFAEEDPTPGVRRVVFEDRVRGIYQKLVVTQDCTRLLGGILVGDARAYPTLVATTREGRAIPESPHELLFGVSSAAAESAETLSDTAQICSCNNVSKGAICAAIVEQELTSVAAVKAATKAGPGGGGCTPLVAQLLEATLAKAGKAGNRHVCEHFPYSREDLFQIVKINRLERFDDVLARHGSGNGCEIC